MSFSQKIKEEVMVASARHCSVCHQYKGLKVEIHHIVPKSKGGEDTESNAISLCFDCHADAGHYFADHPKGTKISPSELKKHKKAWLDLVKTNNIPVPKRDVVHIKHVITDSFYMIKEISNFNLDNFPIKNSLLLNNEVLEFLRGIISEQEYRRRTYESYFFTSEEEYLKVNRKSIISEENEEYNHYTYQRVPNKEEIKQVCKDDLITQYLVDNGCDLNKICIAGAHEDGCAGVDFMESYVVRPIYLKLLTIENLTPDPLTLDSLIANQTKGILYKTSSIDKKVITIPFPKMKIKSGQTIVIPTGIVLASFDDFLIENESTINRFNVANEQRQEFQKMSLKVNVNELEYIGPHIFPHTLVLNEYSQGIHEFDINNLYHIDRYFMCGSCPHLFFVDNENNIKYVKELFSKLPNVIHSEEILIPSNIKSIIVAELENETTYLESILINDKMIINDKTLEKTMFEKIPVNEFDTIIIKGKYFFEGDVFRQLSPQKKQIIIRNFINVISKKS